MISAQDIMDIISLPDDEQNVVISLVRSFKGNKKNRDQERLAEIRGRHLLMESITMEEIDRIIHEDAEKKYGFIEG